MNLRGLLAAGLMLLICCLAIYFASLTGCSRATEPEPIETITESGYQFDFSKQGARTFVDVTRDSVTVRFEIDENGEISCPMLGSWRPAYWNCIGHGIASCRHFYGDLSQPGAQEAYDRCIARAIVACSILDEIFGWLCD